VIARIIVTANAVLTVGLAVALGLVLFGVLPVGRGPDLLTPQGQCEEARLLRQLLENPSYRQRWVESSVASGKYFREDMTETELRAAYQTSFDGGLSRKAAEIEFWCSR